MKFETKAPFTADYEVHPSLQNIAVRTTEGTRMSMSISNVKDVGFRKEWWKFWKK